MPLPKRSIEPVHVARSVYQRDELQPTELETVTNTTLTNIIRQLSSLSKHAEDIFGELRRDVGNIADRANSLQARIDRLAIKVTQLDSTVEEVPLTDIQLKKAFKSANIFDQQIFSRATMPAPMLETYALCDKPPPLDKLNVYRDDGKDGLKFYTDPNYFFELWRQEMLKDTERVMHGKKMHRPRDGSAGGNQSGQGNQSSNAAGGRGHKKRVRTPHNTREKQRQIAIGHGETLMPNNVIYRTPNAVPTDESGYGSYVRPYNMLSHLENNHTLAMLTATMISGMGVYDTRPPRPNSIELRRSYPAESVDGGYGPLSPQAAANAGTGYQSIYGMHPNAVGGQQHMQQMQQQQMNLTQQQQQQQLYDESIYNSQSIYGQGGQGPISQENLYAPGTPSRTKPRPTQPPPAPPSNGSNGGTPNTSNANTPTRGRSMSTGRDNLPPPPPIPDGLNNGGNMAPNSPPPQLNMNGGNVVANKLLGRANSTSRSGSPQLGPCSSVQDANALVMAQLSNQINNLNHINMQMNQINNINDLPPPPPIPDQITPPNSAPPPPPPPPPLLEGPQQNQQQSQQIIPPKPMANGDIPGNHPSANGVIMAGQGLGGKVTVGPKKLLPPFHDTRTDLMKAIRDGITLRKVERTEQKEIERSTGLHDVASILARRVAIELSESEDSESEDDSEGWVEPQETSA
ncbi:actin-binding protein WASF2 isoform X2 [Condylostylus longicornis]|uniref:actin-binding protein WASF2 isoform X2 n=1 Tax=Condylostylus longicornis TaxID=2530218 RepID=UPI00244E3F16|nr:actin-binding protein WASF2 isoform X2 [Condylostylus longicornis]